MNVDITLGVQSIPIAGETVRAHSRSIHFGGKGANQAVAAARAGASVRMLGCVGADEHGEAYLEHLAIENVNAGLVSTAPDGIATGTAFILVDQKGENLIVVEAGANGTVNVDLVESYSKAISDSDTLLLQLECPLPAVKQAAELARSAGTKVVINPSPWHADFVADDFPCDYLIVNSSEARQFLGVHQFRGLSDLTPELVQKLQLRAMIVTQGSGPTVFATAEGEAGEVDPPEVVPVDTVGAGDCFAGAFAVAISEGMPVSEAVRFGNAAGALATLKAGAQSSMPLREEIRQRLG